MNNKVKWVVGIAMLGLVIWGLIAQNNSKKESKNIQETTKQELPEIIKLGAIQGLTGDTANIGEVFKNVLTLAVEEVNANGGINNKKVELVLEDGKCNGKDASSAAQKLVNIDKVQFIIGGLCSGESLAAEPIATAGKVVLASGSATDPKLAGVSPYFFRLAPNDNAQGLIHAQVAEKNGFKKVAVISEQTEYATGLLNSFKKNLEELKGEVVVEEFATNNSNFSTQITKLKNIKPDAIFLNGNGTIPVVKILKQMADQNWYPKIFLNEVASTDINFLNEHKTQLEGAFGVEFKTNPENPKLKTLSAKYKEKYGKELSFIGFSASNYDLVYLFVEGVKTVGYNGEKLATWSRTIKNWNGAVGSVTIKSDGDNESAYSPAVVKNGKLITVE